MSNTNKHHVAHFFFFQAEDGIRDDLVTGVQTCALPISQTPAASGTINLDYRVSVSNSELHLNVNEAANSGYYYQPNNEIKQSAYGLLNGSIGWTYKIGRASCRGRV